jgi:signal transduction histidine kinase
MLSSVAESWTHSSLPLRGVTVEVLLAAVCFSLSAGLTALFAVAPQDPPSLALLVGWPIFALAGGVVLDRRPATRPGRALALLALVPAVDIAWAMARFGGVPTSLDIARAVSEMAAVQAAVVTITIPWAFRSPRDLRPAVGLVVIAATGALAVLFAEAGFVRPQVRVVGWALVALGSAGVWMLVARGAGTDDRTTRRRIAWLLVSLATAGAVVAAAWLLPSPDLGYYVTGSVLVVAALVVARLWLGEAFRPLGEYVLDLVLVVAAVAAAGLMALLVRLGAGLTRLPSANTSAVFTGLVTAAMAAPAALWVRRTMLARRYGNGLISPADVAVITADLHAQTEPRDLLDKAARMVAAASGGKQARIVLGEDAPVVPECWVLHPLDVGGDRVGALVVESRDPEGPELRQQKIIAQLLPTVALVARAVGLAVEAEHARRDVARERDAERKRVMGDLHDGLGPILAGMSMRVQAALRTAPAPEYAGLLTDLAASLAASRTDLRRIVTGITPSTLDDGDLGSALDRLVESFQRVAGGPRFTLEVALDAVLSPAVQVAVYRSVAEGVTNALRHAAASAIDVQVQARAGVVLVDVVDDGVGGQVVPGVGLSSLAQRAGTLGGCLKVAAAHPKGTHLHLELPAGAEAQT